jgi:hypothetical protein
MKRKVIKQGPATLMVSLPSKWVKKYGVKRGDEIELEEEGNMIMLSTSLNLPKKEITINIPRISDYAERFVCASYVKGYDIINIKYDDREIYDKILNTSKLLMGFEIVHNTPNSCKLANISTKLDQNFEILLNRLFMNSISFSKELLHRMKNLSNIQSLLEYEHNANRISFFCKRVIQKSNIGCSVYSSPSLYSIISHVEESIDIFRRITNFFKKNPSIQYNKLKLNKNTINLFEKCIKLLEVNFKIFNNMVKEKKMDLSLNLIKEHKSIKDESRYNPDYFKGDPTNSYICGRLLELIELSHHNSEELFN